MWFQRAPYCGPPYCWGGGIPYREARDRATQMLGLLGLSKKANLRPAQLSGGEKQRVAIGRALIKDPIFCFADEPTVALDWKHGEQVIELLRAAAHDHGSTILVVAHDARIIPHVDRVRIARADLYARYPSAIPGFRSPVLRSIP